MIKESGKCLKTLGVVASYCECPSGCGVMQIVDEKIAREGDGSRAKIEEIAGRIRQEYCPSEAEMVLRRCSRASIWCGRR